jgi:hypothetical protein
MKQVDVFKWALTGVGIYALYKIGTKVGIFQTSTDLQQQQQLNIFSQGGSSSTLGSYWSPAYWNNVAKKYGTATTIGANVANNLATALWDATGIFNDDEEAIYGVFRQLTYLSQISYLAQVFYAKYNQDLYGYLSNHLNNDELNNIANIVSKFKITSKSSI